MAFQDDEEQQKMAGAGSSVLAGSGGAANGAPAGNTGSGFTNLQTYLTANQGQGKGLAGDITSQGQEQLNGDVARADQMAGDWADQNKTAQQGVADSLKADPNSGAQYKATAQPNGLEQNYKNAEQNIANFANDYGTQQAGLQKKYGYGSGFAGLDTFLGRQDGKQQIQDWQNTATAGLKDANGQYKGLASAQSQVNGLGASENVAQADAHKARVETPQIKMGGTTANGQPVNGIASQTMMDNPYAPQKPAYQPPTYGSMNKNKKFNNQV